MALASVLKVEKRAAYGLVYIILSTCVLLLKLDSELLSSRTLKSHWTFFLHLEKLVFHSLCGGEEKVGTGSPLITKK